MRVLTAVQRKAERLDTRIRIAERLVMLAHRQYVAAIDYDTTIRWANVLMTLDCWCARLKSEV